MINEVTKLYTGKSPETDNLQAGKYEIIHIFSCPCKTVSGFRTFQDCVLSQLELLTQSMLKSDDQPEFILWAFVVGNADEQQESRTKTL